MTTYVVSYDLLKEKGSYDYQPLWDELKRLGAQRTQFSVWLVDANNTAEELHNHLKQYIDANDRLLVLELTKNKWYSNAMAGTNAWLEKHRPSR